MWFSLSLALASQSGVKTNGCDGDEQKSSSS
jgi:hypothetical protein